MPMGRWTGRLCLALMVLANGAPCHQALSADISVKTNDAAKPAQAPGRVCTDLNGKTFRWHWANAPFAAVCDAEDAKKDIKPSQPAQKPSVKPSP